MTTRHQTRTAIAHCAAALRQHLAGVECWPTRAALIVAKGAATLLTVEPDVDAAALLRDSLAHSVRAGWITCDDVARAAEAGARGWRAVWHAVVGQVAA
jgi:hypothetical protein